MSSRLVILTPKGLSKIGKAIDDIGGRLRTVSKKTGIPVSTLQMLINREPISEDVLKKCVAAFSIIFDESLIAEPVEAAVNKVRTKQMRAIRQAERWEQALDYLKAAQSISRQAVQNQIIVNDATEELSETPVDDVQGIASAQLKILASYYSEGLTQAKTSFRWAATVSGIGFFFFLAAVILVLNRQPRDRTLIPLISGAVIEVVAGINFYLYGQATKQLATFQRKLDQTQRFLLANSICESLEGDSKQTARKELVKTVSSLTE